MKYVQVLVLGCALMALVGCSPKTHSVSGTVTLDGSSLPDGYVAFVPEGSGEGGGGEIKNGSYSAKLAPGKYKVEITASKMMPLPPGQTGMDGAKEEVRQYIPDKYNVRTELRADVSGSQSLDFQLSSS
jgi:hypothetical protein